VWLVGALLVPLAAVCVFTPAPVQGQPQRRPGFTPNPNVPPPVTPNLPRFPTQEWRCSGCNTLLGTGAIKPMIDRCPNCGIRFNNGFPGAGAGGGFSPGVGGGSSGSTPAVTASTVVMGLAIVAGVLVVLGGVIAAVVFLARASSGSKEPKHRKRIKRIKSRSLPDQI
jgi:hypothetical protein